MVSYQWSVAILASASSLIDGSIGVGQWTKYVTCVIIFVSLAVLKLYELTGNNP